MKSLLEKAKEVQVNKQATKLSENELELVIAWLNDEVQLTQIMKATGKSSGHIYVLLAMGIRQLYRDRRIKIK